MFIIGWFMWFTLRYTDRGCTLFIPQWGNCLCNASLDCREGLSSLCKLCVNQALVAPPVEPFPPCQRSDRKSKWKTTVSIKTTKKSHCENKRQWTEWHQEIIKILWLKTPKNQFGIYFSSAIFYFQLQTLKSSLGHHTNTYSALLRDN